MAYDRKKIYEQAKEMIDRMKKLDPSLVIKRNGITVEKQ